MGKNENLLDEISICCRLPVVNIVSANMDHLTDLSTYNKKRTTVHAGNGVINNNYFLQRIAVCVSAPEYSLLEIQEGDEILFSFTKVMCNFFFSCFGIGTDYSIVTNRRRNYSFYRTIRISSFFPVRLLWICRIISPSSSINCLLREMIFFP